MSALKPRDAKDVEAAVQWAVAEGKALDLVGQGSKRALGRPAQTDLTLDLPAQNGNQAIHDTGTLTVDANGAYTVNYLEDDGTGLFQSYEYKR